MKEEKEEEKKDRQETKQNEHEKIQLKNDEPFR